MNLYIRYFNEETLVYSVEEAIEFISSIPDIHVDSEMIADLRQFAEGPTSYPKRYKIRPRVYFIVIKTLANTMDEFKANNKKTDLICKDEIADELLNRKEYKAAILSVENQGWYEGAIVFKRVIPIPGTGKFQYKDTRFVALVKAQSGQECYDRIIEHLRNRQDVDLRSQFPSARGRNFSYTFLGEKRPS